MIASPTGKALFVAVKTVEMHLSAVYRKLGIRSRRDLPVRSARPDSTI